MGTPCQSRSSDGGSLCSFWRLKLVFRFRLLHKVSVSFGSTNGILVAFKSPFLLCNNHLRN